MSNIHFPESLSDGAKIAIIAPAGSVEAHQLGSTLELINAHGYQPVLGAHLYGKHTLGYEYSGTPEQRLSDLNWAFNEDEIEAVWAARGGYGCQHLLPNIDLKKFLKRPKWYIGYSDNTVIHNYLIKNKIACINGQTIKTSPFGVTDSSYGQIFEILNGELPEYTFKNSTYNKKGMAHGKLIGGNLALAYALLGTPYSSTWENSILFIEDIGEEFYALDRMLTSLEMAGVFAKIKGLIVGGMTNMGKESENAHYASSFDPFANELIAERLKEYDFPTLFCFPNGHIFENLPLIMGAKVKLSVQETSALEYLR